MKKIKEHKDKIIGLIISVIFIVLIFWNLNFHQLFQTFKIFNYKVLLIFVPLYVLGMYIRGFRWKYLLCEDSKLSVSEAFFAFTTGNTINSYLPARAGDIWRAIHVGNKLNESKMKLLGSIILERIIDGISVLMILVFAVLTYFKHQWVLNITYISTALFIGSLAFFYFIFKFNKIDWFFTNLANIKILSGFKDTFAKIAELLNKFMEGFRSLNNPRCFFMAFIDWFFTNLANIKILSGFKDTFAKIAELLNKFMEGFRSLNNPRCFFMAF